MAETETKDNAAAKRHSGSNHVIAISIVAICLCVLLSPMLLYLPFVQSKVKVTLCEKISTATGWNTSINKVVFSPILGVDILGIELSSALNDTIISADNLCVDFDLIHLLKLELRASKASLTNTHLYLASADSSMIIDADLQQISTEPVSLGIFDKIISIENAQISGGDITLFYDSDKAEKKNSPTEQPPFTIIANQINLSDIRYQMSMPGLIDSLSANIESASLLKGVVELRNQNINLHSLVIDNADVRYFASSIPRSDNTNTDIASDTIITKPWDISVYEIILRNAEGLYAISGVKPQKGFDPNYIGISNTTINLSGIHNRGSQISATIKQLAFTERSGIEIIDTKGSFYSDEKSLRIDSLFTRTLLSELKAGGSLDYSLFTDNAANNDTSCLLHASALIDLNDIKKAAPYAKQYLNSIPDTNPISGQLEIVGNQQLLTITKADLSLPKYVDADISGEIKYPFDEKRRSGDVSLLAKLQNINFVKPTIFDAQFRKTVNFPKMTANGKLRFDSHNANGNLRVTLPNGALVAQAKLNNRNEQYTLNLNANDLSIHAFLPKTDFGNLSAQISATGTGLDIMSDKSTATLNAHISDFEFNKVTYHNIDFDIKKQQNIVDVTMLSADPNCNVSLFANANLQGNSGDISYQGNINRINLHRLGLTSLPSILSTDISGTAQFDTDSDFYNLNTAISNLSFTLDTAKYETPQIRLLASSTPDTTSLKLTNCDFEANFAAPQGIESLGDAFTKLSNTAFTQYQRPHLDTDSLLCAIPDFDCAISFGKNNLVQQYLKSINIENRSTSINLNHNKELSGYAKMLDNKFSGTPIDTVVVNLFEHDRKLDYLLHCGNRNGTFDEFAKVDISGILSGNSITSQFTQKNVNNNIGYHFDMNATIGDSAIILHINPINQIINYSNWNVNPDNYVSYSYAKQHLDADLQLTNKASEIQLITNHSEHSHNNLSLLLSNIEIADWIRISPFAPPTTGKVNANLDIAYRGLRFWGKGNASVKNLRYDNKPVGDFALDALMALDPTTGFTRLKANLNANGSNVLIAYGALNDSTLTQPLQLSVEIDSFPLSVANPFIPNEMANLSGAICGKLQMTGSFDRPVYNGSFKAVDGRISIPVFGSHLNISNTDIPIDSNIVTLRDVKIFGANSNPITLNGLIDINQMNNPFVNLQAQGNNVQVIDSKQSKKSQAFGRGFFNIQGSAMGEVSNLKGNANITLLPGSNITYVLLEEINSLTQPTNPDMVHFVNFTDTASIAEEAWKNHKLEQSKLNLNALIRVQSGTTLNIYLSADGKNRITAQGEGALNYIQDFVGNTRLTGQYTISQGSVRYCPPVISEKIFNFNSGSTINFTGDMLNPQLNLSATQKQRASVSQGGGASHLIDFIISAYIRGSLSNMDVAFDLATNDDMNVQNELQSMSADQRSNQAINLMLYNTYTGANTTTQSGNPLYSFLQSQLNTWAANSIKGIDLSFGINQYNSVRDANSTATSYSYKLSKSLFNDRFKIIVGGNYNTDMSTEENFSDNLVSDISFEYLLNQAGNMSVRLFRHTGFESVLEGEVTQTGASFVIRRKLSNLKNLFKFKFRPRTSPVATDSTRSVKTDSITTPQVTDNQK